MESTGIHFVYFDSMFVPCVILPSEYRAASTLDGSVAMICLGNWKTATHPHPEHDIVCKVGVGLLALGAVIITILFPKFISAGTHKIRALYSGSRNRQPAASGIRHPSSVRHPAVQRQHPAIGEGIRHSASGGRRHQPSTSCISASASSK